MKALFACIFLVFTLCSAVSKAQTVFAPPGAEWYHNMCCGVFHCYNAGDSIILGRTCSSIRQIAEVSEEDKSLGLHINDNPTLYTYTSGDTVYIYNRLFSQFTPLYIFNVNDGDTVCIPTFHISYGTSAPIGSVFCFRVDSVRMVLYDTAMLKTVYTHAFESCIQGSVYVRSTYGHVFDEYGAYAERIGIVKMGIFPNCRCCAVIGDMSAAVPGAIRCYTDPELSIKLATGLCGNPPASVSDLGGHVFSISPNPANDIINIHPPSPCTVSLMTIEGKEIFTTQIVRGSNPINVSYLPTGLYLLKFVDESNNTQFLRVQVAH